MMPVCKSCKLTYSRHCTGINGSIELPEDLQEGIRISFCVPARKTGQCTRCIVEQGRVFEQDLVRLVAEPDPKFVRIFLLPMIGSFCPTDFEPQVVFTPG